MRTLLLILACWCGVASAQGWPPEVEAALQRSGLPRDAITLLVTDVDPSRPPRLAHRAQAPVNPASIAKLATTIAALDLLGPAYTWTTRAYVDGAVHGGTLHGNLYLKGSGDPKLVMERLWLLVRKLRGLGITRITGDLVLDQSAFEPAAGDAAAFDGEPLRPYNASPEALLLNFKSVVLTFVPAGGSTRVLVEPPLLGVHWPQALDASAGPCGDWRAGLRLDVSDPVRPKLDGSYPASCGERSWALAFPDPGSFASRLAGAMWHEAGGQLAGQVRSGVVPPGAAAVAETTSPPLAELVRDINKFSNNVMAQQVFLTLSLQATGVGSRERSRAVLQEWWRNRIGPDVPQFDNGSGLSRDERATAEQVARLLQFAWASPLMPELAASLPVVGADGTARRLSPVGAHLKTGSLRDVWGVAGYVHAPDGRRWVLVAIANHPRAAAFRGVADALVAWAARER